MAEEFKDDNIAVNALWPKTGKTSCFYAQIEIIDDPSKNHSSKKNFLFFPLQFFIVAIWTAAVEMMTGDASAKNCRTVDICSGNFLSLLSPVFSCSKLRILFSINQSITQSINQSINRSNAQSLDQSINQSIEEHAIHRPINQSINRWNHKLNQSIFF